MKSRVLIFCAYFVMMCLGVSGSQKWVLSNRGCRALTIKYGRVQIKGRIFAQFSCNKGYILVGDRYSKCLIGGWDSVPPTCVRPDCHEPPQLKNGIIYKSHRGAVLNFYCAANYELQGPKQALCVDLKWNTHLPSCLPTNVTPSLSCDFETEDVCGWSHDLNHNFDWTRMNNKTPSGHLATGPRDDHTKGPGGNGYYMYIEGSSRHANDTARLISPIYRKETNSTCLEFYYHMYGSGIGQLRVYLKKIKDSWDLKVQDALFLVEGNQGNQWWRGFAELGPINDQFQVIIEGVRGFSFISDIAIDDVKIIENCIINIDTTTEQKLEESTFMYESCSGKCNTTLGTSCGCGENCTDDNSCCPDYVAVCVLGNDTDVTDTPIDESITEIIGKLTTVPVPFAGPTGTPTIRITPTTKIITTPSTTRTTTISTTKTTAIPTTKLPTVMAKKPTVTTKKPTVTTKMPFVTTKIPTVRAKIPTFRPKFFWTPSTYQPKLTTSPKRIATKPTPTTPTTTSTSIRPTSRATTFKYFLNDMLTISDEDFTSEEFPVIVPETPRVPTKEYPTLEDTNRSILTDKVAPVHEKPVPSNRTTVIAVLTVCFIVTGILVLIFLVKRFTGKNWMRVRRMRGGNGDSQSDVRFLTSDEILDFTIARPASNY